MHNFGVRDDQAANRLLPILLHKPRRRPGSRSSTAPSTASFPGSRKTTFVSADFEKDDWLAKLVDAGFEPGRPALLLWEGVTMYLDRKTIEDTLSKVAGCAKGTLLAFDYFTTETLESSMLYWRYGRAAAKALGEAMKFGLDSTPPSLERLSELFRSCGLALLEQHGLGRESLSLRPVGPVTLGFRVRRNPDPSVSGSADGSATPGKCTPGTGWSCAASGLMPPTQRSPRVSRFRRRTFGVSFVQASGFFPATQEQAAAF